MPRAYCILQYAAPVITHTMVKKKNDKMHNTARRECICLPSTAAYFFHPIFPSFFNEITFHLITQSTTFRRFNVIGSKTICSITPWLIRYKWIRNTVQIWQINLNSYLNINVASYIDQILFQETYFLFLSKNQFN